MNLFGEKKNILTELAGTAENRVAKGKPFVDGRKVSQLFEVFSKTGDISVRNEIVMESIAIVKYHAKRYKGKGVDVEDLFQIGSLALIEAADRFDISKGFQFSTFASLTVEGKMKNFIRDNAWGVRVPRGLKELLSKIIDFRDEFLKTTGRFPTIEETAAALGVTPSKINEAEIAASSKRALCSIDDAAEHDEEASQGIIDPNLMVIEGGYEMIGLEDVFVKANSTFTPIEKAVVAERIFANVPQRKIAQKLGVSPVAVSRAEKKARHKIISSLSL